MFLRYSQKTVFDAMDPFILDADHTIKNIDLLEEWIASGKGDRKNKILLKIQSLLNVGQYSDEALVTLENIAKNYCLSLSTKWANCSRTRKVLLQRHSEWLSKIIQIPRHVFEKTKTPQELEARTSRGRPRVAFQESSSKTKKRRAQDLLSSHSAEELNFAAELSLKNTTTDLKSPAPQELLALYLDLGLTERKYIRLRKFLIAFQFRSFPSVYSLRMMKNHFLPSDIQVTDTSAEIYLQDLLNSTAKSILHLVNNNENIGNLKLVCKWGFDGSSGHSIYKQKFTENSQQTDEFLFVIALVPLKLFNENSEEIWANPHCSSTLFCRPIKFIFTKEKKKSWSKNSSHTLMNR